MTPMILPESIRSIMSAAAADTMPVLWQYSVASIHHGFHVLYRYVEKLIDMDPAYGYHRFNYKLKLKPLLTGGAQGG